MFHETMMYGKNNKYAMIYAPNDSIEETAKAQVRELLSLPELAKANLAFMPDIHTGVGCTIGTTIKFDSLEEAKINPVWIGNDIGCGLTSVCIGKVEDIELDFDKLDELSKTLNEPVGISRVLNDKKYSASLWKKIGRVSSGNHFMSIDVMDEHYWITVHNGSLSLGQDVYKRYIELSQNKKTSTLEIIEILKDEEKVQHIQPVLSLIKELDKKDSNGILSGRELKSYLSEIQKCEEYALENRLIVIQRVMNVIFNKNSMAESWKKLVIEDGYACMYHHIHGNWYKNKDFGEMRVLSSPHNYIKQRDNGEIIVHKGACSAEKDEDVLIPINMRDGVIVGRGKGNKKWNYAAPHGAGRTMSRTKAKQNIKVEDYIKQLKGVRSISINEKTLDEAPEAYKSMEYILEQIQDTIEVTGIMKPVYNFKAAEEEKYWMRKRREKQEAAAHDNLSRPS